MSHEKMLFAAGVFFLVFVSCSNRDEDINSKVLSNQEQELLNFGKEYGNLHNLLLEQIYNGLIVSTKGSQDELDVNYIVLSKILNHYFINSKTRSITEEYIIDPNVFEMSLDQIRSKASVVDLKSIDKALSTEDQEALDNVLIEAIKANSQSDYNKQAVVAFISTYKSSLLYWQENLNHWDKNVFRKAQTRAWNWGRAAFADAWWGYQGLLMSGGNPIGGAGMAAVASGCSLAFD